MDLEVRWEEEEPEWWETALRRKVDLLGEVRLGVMRGMVGGWLPDFF